MRIKNIAVTVIVFVFITALSVLAWIKPSDEFSISERRYLTQFPDVSFNTIISGRFMKNFEDYSLDQFPGREIFRSIKAKTEISLLKKSENNDVFEKNGFLSKSEYPLNEESITYASEKFRYVYEKYLKDTDTRLYFSIIPDKSYYLIGDDKNHLSLDYESLVTEITSETEYMKYIDIFGELSIDDYYKTDSHWRQEKIVPVAKKIAKEMGVSLRGEYEKNALDKGVYGVYYGQYALPLSSEPMYFLMNDDIKNATVYDYSKNFDVYDLSKGYGRDPYEAFLGGALSLVTIENENASTDKELVMFRDSFGSSIAPLFIEGYKKITLVDIRYIHPDMMDEFIKFNNQDILFLYSTSVLNNSETLK